MNQYPEKLMMLRRHYHISQQQVASFCHVELMEYMSWENGRTMPSDEQIAKMAELFHLSIEDMKSDSLDVPLQEVVEEVEETPEVKEVPVSRGMTREIQSTQVFHTVRETEEEKVEEKTSRLSFEILKDWKIWAILIGILVVILVVMQVFKEPENTLDGIEVNNRIVESERLAAGDGFVLMLNANGTVSGSGKNHVGQLDVSAWRDIAAVSAGSAFSVGLKEDGTVVGAGDNRYGQIDTEALVDIVQISAGDHHLAALDANGSVMCLGDNSEGQCEVSQWQNIVYVSASSSSTLGLCEDGTIVYAGKLDVDPDDLASWTKVKKLVNGQSQVLALTENATVYCTASSSSNVCQSTENWKDVLSVQTAGNHVVALLRNGRLVASGDNSLNQIRVDEFKNIIAIAVSDNFTVTLNRENQLIGTGVNEYDQFIMQEIEENFPLSKVSGITVVIEDEVHVSWGEVSGASYYQVTIPEIAYSANVADLSVSLGLNRFENESSYTVQIRALTMDHSREPSEIASVLFTFFAPEITPEPTPSVVPTPDPTSTPTPEPTPTPEVTPEPTVEPTTEPTVEPTPEPTIEPTTEPTPEPTSDSSSEVVEEETINENAE